MVVKVKVSRKRHVKMGDFSEPTRVKVGFPAGKSDSHTVNKAIWNHYGTSRGIPSRPFLLNAVRQNRSKYLRFLKSAAKQILMGSSSMRAQLSRLGVLAQGDIQMEITALSSPPNTPSTIARKGSSNPLIDTGAMRGAVTWKLDD